MARYTRSSRWKGVYRRPAPVKNRKRWVGTKAAAVVAVTHRRQGQII